MTFLHDFLGKYLEFLHLTRFFKTVEHITKFPIYRVYFFYTISLELNYRVKKGWVYYI